MIGIGTVKRRMNPNCFKTCTLVRLISITVKNEKFAFSVWLEYLHSLSADEFVFLFSNPQMNNISGKISSRHSHAKEIFFASGFDCFISL